MSKIQIKKSHYDDKPIKRYQKYLANGQNHKTIATLHWYSAGPTSLPKQILPKTILYLQCLREPVLKVQQNAGGCRLPWLREVAVL